MLQEANKLLKIFKDSPAWNAPFPMGVFGTLRQGEGNSWLMGESKDGELKPTPKTRYTWMGEARPPYTSHHKAFMPHFAARGLSIHFSPNHAAVFEIFTYTPENWAKMINSVDRLEGFSPNGQRRGWYWRTLVYLHVLPHDFESPMFTGGLGAANLRVLDIPVEKWNKYPKVPCWVYSNPVENLACEQANLPNNPIIWY